MKKILFTIAVLSCSFGGLGDLTRALYNKEYRSAYSRNSNMRDLIVGGPASTILCILGLAGISMKPTYFAPRSYKISGSILMFTGYLIATTTNCFGANPQILTNTPSTTIVPESPVFPISTPKIVTK